MIFQTESNIISAEELQVHVARFLPQFLPYSLKCRYLYAKIND